MNQNIDENIVKYYHCSVTYIMYQNTQFYLIKSLLPKKHQTVSSKV